MVRIAITRGVSPRIGECELTHLDRLPIDHRLASSQHSRYEETLQDLGCRLRRLPPEPDLPDSVFIEDTALVLDEIALICRPGARSRREETRAVAETLGAYRKIAWIEQPATVDGGDLLVLGRTIHIGISSRSNSAAVSQLQSLAGPWGYRVSAVPIQGCLHLKSAATRIGPEHLLINPGWVHAGAFPGMHVVEIDPAEPAAANALLVGDTVIYPEAYPRTRDRLARLGVSLAPVDVAELAKAEGGVTCCSLVFETSP